MTVLHLLKIAGSAWALDQMRSLVELGVRVHVAVPPGPLEERYRSAGVVVHPVQLAFPSRAPWRFAGVAGALRALVAEVRPDVIHSHFVATTLTMRLALGRDHPVPRVFQVPGPLHLEHRFFRWLDLAVAGPRDSWIGTCRWTYDCYRQCGVSAGRVFFSYYGTDVEAASGDQPPGKLRAELGLDDQVKLVGMVSYIYPPKRYLGHTRGIKGHEDLIDALAIALESRPDLLLVVVGGAWKGARAYEARLRRYARRRCGDRAVFLGTRDDVRQLYPDFDVAVHPSLSENVGGAFWSLLQGVPTIATRVGGFPDLVRDGETGWLVPPRDPPALAKAILESLRDPRHSRSMALRGRELARELFDLSKTGREILEVYERVVNTHSRSATTTEVSSIQAASNSNPPKNDQLTRRSVMEPSSSSPADSRRTIGATLDSSRPSP